MIYGSIGDPGTGKTLWLSSIAYDSEGRVDIYSNMQGLKLDYFLLEDYRDIENIPKDKKDKILIIDELHMFGGDSWRYNILAKKLAKLGTQHRKLHCNIYYTTQYFSQIINRIRFLTTELYSHDLDYFTPEGKPLALHTNVYGKREKDYFFKNDFIWPLITRDNRLVCDLYDTDEFIADMVEPGEILKDELIEKYSSFSFEEKGADKYLKSVLILKENCPKDLAALIVNYLAYGG